MKCISTLVSSLVALLVGILLASPIAAKDGGKSKPLPESTSAEPGITKGQADAILAELSQILVSRDLPLDFHPLALKAAEAARCAGDQGKYWELRDELFSNPSAANDDVIKKSAERPSLKMKGFQACLDSDKYRTEIQRDARQRNRKKLSLRGRPCAPLIVQLL